MDKDIFEKIFSGESQSGSLFASLKHSNLKLSNFELKKKIKEEDYSIVLEVEKKEKETKKPYIIKKLLLSKEQDEETKNEMIRRKTILETLCQKKYTRGLACPFEKFEDSGDYCFVFNYFNKKDLLTLMEEYCKKNGRNKPIKENIIVNIFIEIVEGLGILHKNKLMHRDIVPENILISSEKEDINEFNDVRASLTGFRLSAYFDEKNINDKSFMYTNNESVGLPDYVCPEILQDQDYNESSDIFSLGMVLFQLMTFDLPFKTIYDEQSGEYVRTKSSAKIDDKNYSEKLINLVYEMISDDPQKRPDYKKVYCILNQCL